MSKKGISSVIKKKSDKLTDVLELLYAIKNYLEDVLKRAGNKAISSQWYAFQSPSMHSKCSHFIIYCVRNNSLCAYWTILIKFKEYLLYTRHWTTYKFNTYYLIYSLTFNFKWACIWNVITVFSQFFKGQ